MKAGEERLGQAQRGDARPHPVEGARARVGDAVVVLVGHVGPDVRAARIQTKVVGVVEDQAGVPLRLHASSQEAGRLYLEVVGGAGVGHVLGAVVRGPPPVLLDRLYVAALGQVHRPGVAVTGVEVVEVRAVVAFPKGTDAVEVDQVVGGPAGVGAQQVVGPVGAVGVAQEHPSAARPVAPHPVEVGLELQEAVLVAAADRGVVVVEVRAVGEHEHAPSQVAEGLGHGLGGAALGQVVVVVVGCAVAGYAAAAGNGEEHHVGHGEGQPGFAGDARFGGVGRLAGRRSAAGGKREHCEQRNEAD